MEYFNRDEYEIREVEETKIIDYYVIFKNGEKMILNYSSIKAAENEIDQIEAFSKIRYLPFYRPYFYCREKEDFLNYAKYMSFRYTRGNDFVPDNYFLDNSDEFWHGPDWYELSVDEKDSERHYSCNSFKDYKEERETQINDFERALKAQLKGVD